MAMVQALAFFTKAILGGDFAVVQQDFYRGDTLALLSSWAPDFEPVAVGSMRTPEFLPSLRRIICFANTMTLPRRCPLVTPVFAPCRR